MKSSSRPRAGAARLAPEPVGQRAGAAARSSLRTPIAPRRATPPQPARSARLTSSAPWSPARSPSLRPSGLGAPPAPRRGPVTAGRELRVVPRSVRPAPRVGARSDRSVLRAGRSAPRAGRSVLRAGRSAPGRADPRTTPRPSPRSGPRSTRRTPSAAAGRPGRADVRAAVLVPRRSLRSAATRGRPPRSGAGRPTRPPPPRTSRSAVEPRAWRIGAPAGGHVSTRGLPARDGDFDGPGPRATRTPPRVVPAAGRPPVRDAVPPRVTAPPPARDAELPPPPDDGRPAGAPGRRAGRVDATSPVRRWPSRSPAELPRPADDAGRASRDPSRVRAPGAPSERSRRAPSLCTCSLFGRRRGAGAGATAADHSGCQQGHRPSRPPRPEAQKPSPDANDPRSAP